VSTVTLNCKLIEPNVVEKDLKIKELDVLKKALTRVLEDGDDSYEFVQARIDTINDELFTDEYNVARYLDAFNKKLNLYWFF
jgi:predicted lysophospholipase L1 biosynthesis ABC-type transport system permease subunit